MWAADARDIDSTLGRAPIFEVIGQARHRSNCPCRFWWSVLKPFTGGLGSTYACAALFLSTLLLILRRDRPRLQVFHIVVWGLAVGIGLLFGLSSLPRLFWVLWGIWLYIGLAVNALLLELLVFVVGRRNRQI